MRGLRWGAPLRSLAASLLLLGSAACAPEPPPPDRFTVRDSAGVAIAVSTFPAWEEDPSARWTIDTVPLLDLTTTDSGPQHEFYQVMDGTVLDDGRIVVANDGSSEIRFYGEDGAFLEATGREGEGPGEFKQIMSLSVLGGDTLGVFSWDRWTVLGPDLSVVRTTTLGHQAWMPMTLGRGEMVTMQMETMMEYEGGTGLYRPDAIIVKRDALSGEVLDTLWSGPGHESLMVRDGERLTSSLTLFQKSPAHTTHDGALWVGSSDAMSYRVIRADGSLERIVRVPTYDLVVTSEMMAQERARYLGDDPSPRRRRFADLMPDRDTRPAYGEFFVDTEGNLWAGGLRTFMNYNDPRPFEVFSPEGEWLGSIVIPARFDVLDIGSDYLLGSRRDSLDVEHVQLLRLMRTRGDSSAP